MNVFEAITNFLDENKVKYRTLEHEPTPTSADAARVRATSPEQGAKAMVLRSKGKFTMCVLSGDRKINFKRIKDILGTKSVSFASADEVFEVTHCKPGGVPPFGNLFHIPIILDQSITKNEEIAFNAGVATKSIIMKTKDYLKIVDAEVENFSESM